MCINNGPKTEYLYTTLHNTTMHKVYLLSILKGIVYTTILVLKIQRLENICKQHLQQYYYAKQNFERITISITKKSA